GVLAGAARHPSFTQHSHDLVLAALARPLLDDRIQCLAIFPAHLGGVETGIVGQLGATHRPYHGRPHLLLRGDEDVVVWAPWRAGISCARDPLPHLVAAPRHGMTKALVVAQADPDQVDDGILHRDFDMLAAP